MLDSSHDKLESLRTRDLGDGQTIGSRLASFMGLSNVLLGAGTLSLDLPEWLGLIYFETLLHGAEKAQADPTFQPRYTAADIRATLAAYDCIAASNPPDLEEAVRQQIVVDGGSQSVVAKSMIALWYCAGLIDLTAPSKGGMGYLTLTAPKATYGQALVWQTFGGNPMGIPGPYYGNWSYPATTPILPPPARREVKSAGTGNKS